MGTFLGWVLVGVVAFFCLYTVWFQYGRVVVVHDRPTRLVDMPEFRDADRR